MAWLLGIRDANTLDTHAARGALFETFVVSELIKQRFNQGQASDLYFWRDSAGHEVDVLLETPTGLQAIEIKSGSTFATDWIKSLKKWQTLAGGDALTPQLIFGGTGLYEREDCKVMGWQNLS
jgi:predicted AAA+ superfamily ATPase